MTWKKILLFIVSATILTVLSGWLIGSNFLPIQIEINYSEAERSFVQIWVQIALVIGLLLPGLAFLVWIRHAETRLIFGFYLLVLAIQIITEQLVSRVFSSSLLVIVGTLYTLFRVWQLWQGQQFLKVAQNNNIRTQIAASLIWLLLLFWSSNLIFLFLVAWLKIL